MKLSLAIEKWNPGGDWSDRVNQAGQIVIPSIGMRNRFLRAADRAGVPLEPIREASWTEFVTDKTMADLVPYGECFNNGHGKHICRTKLRLVDFRATGETDLDEQTIRRLIPYLGSSCFGPCQCL